MSKMWIEFCLDEGKLWQTYMYMLLHSRPTITILKQVNLITFGVPLAVEFGTFAVEFVALTQSFITLASEAFAIDLCMFF